MRLFTATLLFLFLVPALVAQPCDPAGDQACADTTDWQRYVPLAVGNQWQYRDASVGGETAGHWSWRVIGEAEVGGQAYFEIERCDEAADGGATCADPVLVRYDAANAMLVRRDGDEEVWWDEVPCRLDVAFNETDEGETYGCTGPGTEGTAFAPALGAYDASVTVPPDEVTGDTRKQFAWLGNRNWEVFAGLGVTEFYYELQEEPSRLVYAFVDGQQVGAPAFAVCDPSEVGEGIVCPDTTDWRRYFPLEVGNQWQYHVDRFIKLDYDHGTEIVGQTEIDGENYFLARSCTKVNFGELTCGSSVPVRYEEESNIVVRLNADDSFSQYQVSDYWVPPCPLDAPFGETVQTCTFFEGVPYWASGAYEVGHEGLGDTRKVFGDGLQGTITLVAGLGPIGSDNVDNDIQENLAYARIGDGEVGTPAFAFPTDDEPNVSPLKLFVLRAVYPNPVRDAVMAGYELDRPQTVTVEIADMLGRVVRTVQAGLRNAGLHQLQVATADLAPGVYVLRLRGEDAEATRRFVVVR